MMEPVRAAFLRRRAAERAERRRAPLVRKATSSRAAAPPPPAAPRPRLRVPRLQAHTVACVAHTRDAGKHACTRQQRRVAASKQAQRMQGGNAHRAHA
jgi:hypothetical protein